jgi:hypothetical protein
MQSQALSSMTSTSNSVSFFHGSFSRDTTSESRSRPPYYDHHHLCIRDPRRETDRASSMTSTSNSVSFFHSSFSRDTTSESRSRPPYRYYRYDLCIRDPRSEIRDPRRETDRSGVKLVDNDRRTDASHSCARRASVVSRRLTLRLARSLFLQRPTFVRYV